jgi:hypothetical protein
LFIESIYGDRIGHGKLQYEMILYRDRSDIEAKEQLMIV